MKLAQSTLKPLFAAAILSLAVSSCVENKSRAAYDCVEMSGYSDREAVPSNHRSEGKASYYADVLVGMTTAYGEIYTHDCMTAAHRTLPYNTRAHVVATFTDAHGKPIETSIRVRINDTGPFIRGTETPHPERPIDLSKRAFRELTHGLKAVKGPTGELRKADGLSLGILQDIRITEVVLPEEG